MKELGGMVPDQELPRSEGETRELEMVEQRSFPGL
jgi:hypothetical protein